MIDTVTLTFIATAAGVLIALAAGFVVVAAFQGEAAARRLPAATFLENLLARLEIKKAELAELDADIQRRREEHRPLLAEFESLAARRDAAEIRLAEIRAEIETLADRRREAEQVAGELAEARTQLAEFMRDLFAARTEREAILLETTKARAEKVAAEADRDNARVAADEAERKADDAQGRFVELDRQLTALGEALASRQGELNTLNAALEGGQQEVRRLDDQVVELQHALRERRVALEEGDTELRRLEMETEDARRKAEEAIALAGTRRVELDQLAPALAAAHQRLSELGEQVQRHEARTARLEGDLADLAAARQRAIAEEREARDRSSAVMEELRRIEGEIAERQSVLDRISTTVAEMERQVGVLDSDLSRKQGEVIKLQERKEAVERAFAAAKKSQEEIQAQAQDQRKERDQLSLEIATLRQSKNDLSEEIAHKQAQRAKLDSDLNQRSGQGETGASAGLDALRTPPSCLIDERGQIIRPAALEGDTEEKALDRVRAHLKALDLVFPERTIKAFHTALKLSTISPLTVLAGISGTGKSQLPRRYAEAMGFHFLKLPVQPRWDSPQDMLGFYNYLEKRYKATELARALAHLDMIHSKDIATRFEGRLLLVLLDEMNLARVEYYFSEFLSQLEGRPGPGEKNPNRTRSSEIVLDVGGSGRDNQRVYVGHNVLFVGTMNEDESTQTLSDKVLDRANVLRFARPSMLSEKEPVETSPPTDRYLPENAWHNWRRSFAKNMPSGTRETVNGWVRKLNDALDGLRRPFAHRVNQALLAYVANYPGSPDMQAVRMAFADQLEQRILPKLRGVELGETNENYLRRIGDLIREELRDEELSEAFARAIQDDGSGRPFAWPGVRRTAS